MEIKRFLLLCVNKSAKIEPVTQRYTWARAALILLSIVWANWEYRKTKQALGL